MQALETKNIEWNTAKENIEKQKKDFADCLRKKFHEYKKDCTLTQLTKLDKNLKEIANTICNIFWDDSEKVFNLFKELPAQYVENFSINGDEVVKSLSQDLKDDINVLDKQEFVSWYIKEALKRLQNKQQAESADKSKTVDYEEKRETSEQLKEAYNQALKDKEAVQQDPQTAQHFKTDEYKAKRRSIKGDLEARPDLKSSLQASFWNQAPTLDDLADLVATKEIIKEKGLNTTATSSFLKSYNYLDDVLHFGSYSAGEMGKNDNILTNSSYTRLLDKQDWSENFINKRPQTMDKNDNIAHQNKQLWAFIATTTRIESVRSYNGFIWWLFNGDLNGKNWGDSVFIKTSDDKLKITDESIKFEFMTQGQDCEFEAKDGKLYLTNPLKKNEQTKTFTIWGDEVPLNGAKIPSIQEIINEVYSTMDAQTLWFWDESIKTPDDLLKITSIIRQNIQKIIDEAIKKQSNEQRQGEISKAVCDYTQKYIRSSRLLSMYYPPNYDYNFQNKLSPQVSKNNKKTAWFYDYLDILRNTFYDERHNLTAQSMGDFTTLLKSLFENKAIKPQEFFSNFSDAEFINTREGTDQKFIDLEKFSIYAKTLLEKQQKTA